MKKNIILLILDDIKVSRLLHVLEMLDISTKSYHLCNSIVIFDLMELPAKDEYLDSYYKLIELAVDIESYDTFDKKEVLALEVYNFLLSIQKISKTE